jgi:hypothetical protein
MLIVIFFQRIGDQDAVTAKVIPGSTGPHMEVADNQHLSTLPQVQFGGVFLIADQPGKKISFHFILYSQL